MANLGSVHRWIEQNIGGSFELKQKTVPLPVAGATVVDANPNRWMLLIMNSGANLTHLMPGRLNLAKLGVVLTSAGGSFSTQVRDDLVLPTLEFSAWADANPTTLEVIEIVQFSRQSRAKPAEGT